MCGSLFKSFGCMGLFTDADRVFRSLLRVCVLLGLFTDAESNRVIRSLLRVCV